MESLTMEEPVKRTPEMLENGDDGMSEEVSSSCLGSSSDRKASTDPSPMTHSDLVTSLPSPAPAATAVNRFASVNFRFGSAWFLAPFRTFIGDMVVVQYPGNGSLHIGLVTAISTAKPETFFSEENQHPNFLTEEEKECLPRLLRHARDFDKDTKLGLRAQDLRSLENAQKLADELNAPVQFLDAEWLLDLNAITFLVEVYEDVEIVDALADQLAREEGAEVVFTYPTVMC
ncbi:hypothetical protein STCU_01276 [Strigomonas culicis]|uniref:Uncharacterized protein n=1 Tax=Strigomonas culicis TaxID=28005 RepID=S9V238_9TRYP|nr:hypothetical protein STCU_01276 [Strigomonas culicis]|eukprot:EPY35048.1 hypothetical protein STCU_01276 [Strigomonas culicis]